MEPTAGWTAGVLLRKERGKGLSFYCMEENYTQYLIIMYNGKNLNKNIYTLYIFIIICYIIIHRLYYI